MSTKKESGPAELSSKTIIEHVEDLGRQEAAGSRHYFVQTEHLFLAILRADGELDGSCSKLFLSLKTNKGILRRETLRLLTSQHQNPTENMEKLLTPQCERIISRAEKEAEKDGKDTPQLIDLLFALVSEEKERSLGREVLSKHRLSPYSVKKHR